ncbi:MAG: hypothetical protein PHS49_01800 [Candidatus Gracilibacteria bacterium]|nr:hypothetical protein [Candidatus Gracilibacteria bacterium]
MKKSNECTCRNCAGKNNAIIPLKINQITIKEVPKPLKFKRTQAPEKIETDFSKYIPGYNSNTSSNNI